jgi:hypothetical protein
MKRTSLSWFGPFRLWKAVLASFVGAVAVTVVVRATIPDAAGVIHGCYSRPGSNLYVIDSAVGTCKNGDTALTWNVQGPPGPAGPMGPSDGFWKNDLKTFTSVNLDGNTTDLETLSQLPAGSYVFSANLAFANSTTLASVQCFLLTSDNPPVFLSEAVQTTVGGSLNSFGSMTIVGAGTFTAPKDVKASCISAGTVFTQPSSLTAIRVATLTVQQ